MRSASSAVATADPVDARCAAAARPATVDTEVLLGLRGLGVTAGDAREAVRLSVGGCATTLEDRLRGALQALRTIYANRTAEPPRRWPVLQRTH